ncbi:MAG: glycosyltransferase, partial [Deltaproteobacteria bacterium]
QFNLLDLKHHHYPNPQLLPLIDFSKDLAELKTPSIRLLKTEPKNLLFVGRLTPHKNQALLIKTFFYLKKSLPKGSKLFLVGTQDPTYTEYLKLLTKQLGLSQEVKITGPVTRKSLENYYEISDALVCLSEQEGFCIPLVEAMSRHLPIFFHPNTGVQETMGKSGCALNTQNPWEIAEIISTVLNSNQAMNSLVKSQHRRWVELSREQNSKKVQDLLLDLVIKLRTTPSLQMNRRGASHFLTQG